MTDKNNDDGDSHDGEGKGNNDKTMAIAKDNGNNRWWLRQVVMAYKGAKRSNNQPVVAVMAVASSGRTAYKSLPKNAKKKK